MGTSTAAVASVDEVTPAIRTGPAHRRIPTDALHLVTVA